MLARQHAKPSRMEGEYPGSMFWFCTCPSQVGFCPKTPAAQQPGQPPVVSASSLALGLWHGHTRASLVIYAPNRTQFRQCGRLELAS